MPYLLQAMQSRSQEVLAGASVGSFGASIATVNEYLQMVALVVSITTGAIVLYKHFKSRGK